MNGIAGPNEFRIALPDHDRGVSTLEGLHPNQRFRRWSEHVALSVDHNIAVERLQRWNQIPDTSAPPAPGADGNDGAASQQSVVVVRENRSRWRRKVSRVHDIENRVLIDVRKDQARRWCCRKRAAVGSR